MPFRDVSSKRFRADLQFALLCVLTPVVGTRARCDRRAGLRVQPVDLICMIQPVGTVDLLPGRETRLLIVQALIELLLGRRQAVWCRIRKAAQLIVLSCG